jgi:hypothetical protein
MVLAQYWEEIYMIWKRRATSVHTVFSVHTQEPERTSCLASSVFFLITFLEIESSLYYHITLRCD